MAAVMMGETEVALSRPDDLDARVLALTGLSPAELAATLQAPSPPFVAVAIAALGEGALPARAEIGALLAEADLPAIAAILRPLLVSEPVPVPVPVPVVMELAPPPTPKEETAHVGE